MPKSASSPDLSAIRAAYDEASQALAAGDVSGAEQICRRTFPQHGRDINLLCLLGEICLRQRKPQEAKNLYTEALQRQPDFPRALEGMGLALLADKKPSDASDFLSRAVKAAPNRSKTRMALARALAEAGHHAESDETIRDTFEQDPSQKALSDAEKAILESDLEAAEKILKKLLSNEPDNVKALRMLGNIAGEAGRTRAARQLIRRSLELEPGFVPAWNDLANLEMKLDRYDEALKAVDKSVEIDPGLAQTYIIKGNILTRAQRHEESLEAYHEALGLNPESAGALSAMAHVLKTVGRQEESIEAYRRCIKRQPAFGEAYWSLANLKTFEFNEDEVRTMQDMVKREALPDETRVNFYLSLGKHFENEKNFDAAFEHYRNGNDLRRQHEIYDPVQTQVVHDRIMDVFDRAFFETHEGWGDPDPSPILIVGLPRSGSTLIEQILASHSQVEGTMELPDLSRITSDLSKRSPRRSEYPEAIRDQDVEQIAAMGRQYIESTMRYRSGKAFFIDKMPNNFVHIGLLKLILPNAKVVNARRHPLDSCLGSYKQLFFKGQSFTYDQFELGHYYLQYQRIMDHWHDVLPGKVLDVRYEDMVQDQETQTRRLLEHLGLPWEDRVLRFYETERAINTASSEQVRQPIYTKALNFWRNYEPHLGELIETLEPLLRELPSEDRPESLR